MREYHRAVLCAINNDHRRNLRERGAPQANNDEEVKLADRAVMPPSGEGRMAPAVPEWPESHRPRLCSKGAASSCPETSGDSMAPINTQTPKRARAAKKR